MITLVTTRFNSKTWNEMQRWIETNSWDGCIYGCPIMTKRGIGETLIVLEMHNDENKVKAVGLINNYAFPADKKYTRIYNDRNYNRYIYKSKYRLILSDITLTLMEKKIIKIFNQLLFKGACHLKRAQGITEVPSWIMKNKHIDFLKYFKALLVRQYKKESLISLC